MCAECSKPVKEMQGIFCGNFCISQNNLPPCHNMWHVACYTYCGGIKFPMPGIVDEEGNPWHNEEAGCWQMMEGVEGSHLCIPFQCKLCWYRNLKGRDPTPGREDVYISCIRQANLDAMLGKSPLTIRAHRSQTLASLQNAMRIGKTPTYHPRGPFPVGDPVGMSLAVDMILKSLVAKGRIMDQVQFAMLQKMRSTYTKNWELSPAGVKEGAAFANGKYQVRQTTCPAQSEWFYYFLRGLEFPMGCQSNPNHGLLMGEIVYLLKLIKINAEEAEEAGEALEANKIWKVGAYVYMLIPKCIQNSNAFGRLPNAYFFADYMNAFGVLSYAFGWSFSCRFIIAS
jgi:hypothetical protein